MMLLLISLETTIGKTPFQGNEERHFQLQIITFELYFIDPTESNEKPADTVLYAGNGTIIRP